jgi:hypothetical protein
MACRFCLLLLGFISSLSQLAWECCCYSNDNDETMIGMHVHATQGFRVDKSTGRFGTATRRGRQYWKKYDMSGHFFKSFNSKS